MTPIQPFILDFAKAFSTYKTPAERTKGARESENQRRGEPDWIDTIATLMLWRELASAGLPVTFHLTANTGDETDLRVQKKGSERFIDINVKATKSPVPARIEPCTYGNLPVKYEELGVTLYRKSAGSAYTPSVMKQPMNIVVQEREDGRMLIGNEAEAKLLPLPHLFIKVFVHLEEGEPHVHFCRWLDTRSPIFQQELNAFALRCEKGAPPLIPGIRHPGLWIPSGNCRDFGELNSYLMQQSEQDSLRGTD